MAKKEKQVVDQVNEDEVAEDTTTAIDTLHPAAKAVSDPQSITNFGKLAQMIGAVAAARDDVSKTDWYKGMIEWNKRAGHGVGVDDETDHNRDSIKAGGSNVAKAANPAQFSNPGAINPHSTGNVSSPGEVAAGTRANPDHFKNPGAGSSTPGQVDLLATVKEEMKKEVADILGEEEGLSEELKTKFATLFEVAVGARVNLEVIKLVDENEKRLEEQMIAVVEASKEGMDAFCDYVAETWLTENQVAVESSLRAEITEEFINGLKSLFENSFIDVPEDKFDVVDALAQKVDELETRLSEAIEENADLRQIVANENKEDVFEEVATGLTVADAERFRTLAEEIDDEGDLEAYKGKLSTLKDHYFKKEVKSTISEDMATTDNELTEPEKTRVFENEVVKAAYDAISRTNRGKLI